MKGILFFGIVFIIVGIYYFRKARAPSTLKEPNNSEFATVGTALSVCFFLGGLFLIASYFFGPPS